MRCKYLTCAAMAKGKVLLNALQAQPGSAPDRELRVEVPMCQEHADAMEHWLPRHRPHLTSDGSLYVGELNELVHGGRTA